MRATPLLVAAFMAAGCSFALAQAGSGGAAGASGAGSSGAAGAAAGVGTGGAGTGGTSTGGATAGNTSGNSAAGADQRARRSFGRLKRSDEMAPLVIPREEAPVRLRTRPYRHREW